MHDFIYLVSKLGAFFFHTFGLLWILNYERGSEGEREAEKKEEKNVQNERARARQSETYFFFFFYYKVNSTMEAR